MNLHSPSSNKVTKSRRQKICLSMIVKDDAPEILARCLASVRPLIDFWIIVDSGSTDGTPDVVRSVLHDIPGELHQRPWVDFGHNRSEALSLARAHGDYTLIIDPAEILELPPGFRMPFLKKDSYAVEIWNGEHHYWLPQLVRNSVAWRYEGVLHEFLSCASGPDDRRVLPHERSHKRLPGPRIRITKDGVRGQLSANERYREDAAVLEHAIATETDPFLVARYKFQLAQIYLDAGDKEKALVAYQERATLGFWDQEVFISLYRSANLKADLGYDEEDVIASYLRAYDISKDRAEALYGAARFCRIKQRYQQGFDLAKRALKIKPPAEALFLEEWIYQYGLLDEFAVNGFWIGRYGDCLAACDRLLREGRIPAADRERIEQNARVSREKLSSQRADAKTGKAKVSFTSRSHGEAPTPIGVDAAAVQSPIKTIGLCMIVKNESHIIMRCLESVRPLIDYVLIEDTGSTDGTQALIRDWLDRVGLPGEVYEEPWRDFAYNRSHALASLREHKDLDYALMIDADDQLIVDADFDVVAFKKSLSKDQYDVEMRQAGVRYRNPQICSNRREFRYRSVLHEFLQSPPGDVSTGAAAGIHIISGREGARSQDPNKYRKDVEVLEQALRSEQDAFLRSRYIFYLAQSYRDAGENEKALENYLKRAELGSWTEEVFVSLYAAAQIKQQMGRPFEEVIATYLRASNLMPSRAEALHGASRLSRENNRFAEGYEFASRGLKIPLPVGGLFVEPWIYQYGLLDEFAVNAYWTGRYDDCLTACERLLREGKIPAEDRERIEQNARFAREKLSSPPEQDAPSGETEEVFVNLYNAAEHLRAMGRPFDEVIAAYELASNAAPDRAEALHGASCLCRANNKFVEGYEYARRGLTIPRPNGGRSVQQWIYDYGLLDEFAVHAYWTERYHDCLDACQRLLREGRMPEEMHDRVRKNADFAADKIRLQELGSQSSWTPPTAAGGTELMVEGLRARIPDALARIQLQVNLFPDNLSDDKPLVIWIHHDIDQAAVQWLQDQEKVRRVAWFIFVSEWQQARFVKQFGLPSEKCIVLRNATEVCSSNRTWDPGRPLRMAYASIPYRGLSVLLDAWDQLRPADAELHIWSSIKLYGPGFDEEPYRNLYDRALLLPGVEYHGLVPNAELRSALRNIDFLTYPSTFAETSCLSVIEAMAAGCRVICPSFGALPETTGKFARLYPFLSDPADHAKLFAQVLAEEILHPWGGKPELSGQQQNYVRGKYDWSVRVAEWEAFIDLAVGSWNVPRC